MRNTPNQQFEELQQKLVPLTFGRINTSRGKPTPETLRVLFDSGGSGTVLTERFARKLKRIKCPEVKWNMMAGKVTTSEMAKVQFSLPELYDNCLIEWEVHPVKSLGSYNMVIG